ncbi:MAG: ATP-binding protein, partial [Firmicutes bacterium]|nr:ATP-binding protein [Bacillota bacterium]
RAATAARNVQFVELGSDPNFTTVFAESMLFPEQEEN